jgi:hypothetical protein
MSRPQPEITSAHQNVIAENVALRAELAASKKATKVALRAPRKRTKG